MQRLRMPVKLTTMACMLGLPLVVVSYLLLSTLFDEYVTARNELFGAQALERVSDVLTDVQQLRSAATLVGSRGATTAAAAEKLKIDQAAVDAITATLTTLDTQINDFLNPPAPQPAPAG